MRTRSRLLGEGLSSTIISSFALPAGAIAICIAGSAHAEDKALPAPISSPSEGQLTAAEVTPEHVPFFVPGPGETDVLTNVMAVVLVLVIALFGVLFLRLHTLPERIAHRSQKLQFEIVALLGLLALFTHIHLFWVAGLLLAFIELPDFSTPLGRMARSLERIADGEAAAAAPLAVPPDGETIAPAQMPAEVPAQMSAMVPAEAPAQAPPTIRPAGRGA